jgi:hypothetical protein
LMPIWLEERPVTQDGAITVLDAPPGQEILPTVVKGYSSPAQGAEVSAGKPKVAAPGGLPRSRSGFYTNHEPQDIRVLESGTLQQHQARQ